MLVTEHPKDKNTVYAIICNCSPDTKKVTLDIKDGWTAESFYSDTDLCFYNDGILNMTNNGGMILVLKRENDRRAGTNRNVVQTDDRQNT